MLTEKIVKIIPYLASILYSSLYITKVNLYEFILIVIPYSMIFFICVKAMYSIILFQFVYYYIITYYLREKLKIITNKLKQIIRNNKRKQSINVWNILREMNSVYDEINEYNSNYWSKFLAIIWITFSFIISSAIFLSLFTKVVIYLKIIITLFALIFSIILIFIIHISSVIYIEINNSYVLLNSIIHCIQIRLHLKIKVKIIYKFYINF